MGKFNYQRPVEKVILPSGVEAELTTLIGDHQDWITKNDPNQVRNGIDRLFKDCVVSIGGVKPTKEMLQNFLVNDKMFCLFFIRQFSNKRNKDFVFKYEFPVDKQGKKRVQKYEVEFNREDFPQKPYSWVFEKMKKEYYSENKLDLEEDKVTDKIENAILGMKFIKCYETYEDMLAEQSEQKIVLPDSEVEVFWTLLNSKKERSFGISKQNKDASSHDQIFIHSPVFEEDGYEEGDVRKIVPVGKLSMDDIEALRGHIIQTEGKIDTSVVINYKETPGTETMLNLLSVPTFFFPSLAN